jgi:hypothetical protein
VRKLDERTVTEKLEKLNIKLLEPYVRASRYKTKLLHVPSNTEFRENITSVLSISFREKLIQKCKEKKINLLTHIEDIIYGLKFKVQCQIDGYQWYTTVHQLLYRNKGCHQCGGSLKLTNEKVDQKLKENNRKIKRIENYINADTKIQWECLVDGYRWKAKPTDVLNYNNGCPKCANKHPLTNKEIDMRLQNTDLVRIDTITESSLPINFKCKRHKHKIYKSPREIYNKPICPYCKNKKEYEIKTFLENNIAYSLFVHQYMIKESYIPNYYLIDFYLELEDEKYFIEYNGPHHYRPVRYNSEPLSKAQINHKKQKIRDSHVRRYCSENNIKLLEIPYWLTDNDIYSLIKEKISIMVL